MSSVKRVYVEKKPEYAVRAKELQSEIRSYLGISGVTKVRELIRYDIENISGETYKKALVTVFSEPPVDDIYEEEFDLNGAGVRGSGTRKARFEKTPEMLVCSVSGVALNKEKRGKTT